MEISKTWTELKSLYGIKNFALQYEYMTNPNRYFIFAEEGNFIYTCLITDSSDITDFENNYKDDCNKPINDESAILAAKHGETVEEFANITGIDSGSYTQIINHTVPSNKTLLITDLTASGTNNGIFRMKLDGNIVCVMYYGARRYINCTKSSPSIVVAGTVLIIEFKPDADGTDVSVNLGGIEQ